MKQGIIIVTSFKTESFLLDLLDSLLAYKQYPTYIHKNTAENNQYEMGGIKLGLKLELDEFFLLPDSCVIKDTNLFDIVFEDLKGFSCSLGGDLYHKGFMSYIGKYRREILLQMEIPEIKTKRDAVKYEHEFNNEYMELETKYIELFPGFWDQLERYEFKNGRNNLINENEFIKKFKGTWAMEMINE